MSSLILILVLLVSFSTSADNQWINPLQPSPLTFTGYGDGIANMGQWLVVGDPLNDDIDIDTGAVYVYQNQNGEWLLYQTLYANDADARDEFGSVVDIEIYHPTGETWIVVSALRDDEGGLDNGAVYAFQLDMNGDFTQYNKFLGESNTISQNFGTSIAINYDYISEVDAKLWILAIGDDYKRLPYGPNDPNAGSNHATGGVDIYKKLEGLDNQFWEKEIVQMGLAYLDGLDTFDFIGKSVSVEGKYMLAGAPGDDSHELGTDGIDTGAIHFLVRDHLTQSWTCCGIVKAPNLDRSARFGEDVEVIKQPGSNRVLMASAPFEDAGTNVQKGAVYVYYNSAFVQKLEPTNTDGGQGQQFGAAIAANGDEFYGSTELLVGAPFSEDKKGRIYHYTINPDFDGSNDFYIKKGDIVAFNRDEYPWDTGQFGINVSTDGLNHATSSKSNYIGNHKSVYTKESPIFINGFE